VIKQTSRVCRDDGAVTAEDGNTILLWDGSNAGEFIKAKRGVISSTSALVNASHVVSDYSFICAITRAKNTG